MKWIILILWVFILQSCSTNRKSNGNKELNTHNSKNSFETPYSQDILRGSNNEYRNWWDVLHYSIFLIPNITEKSIQGNMEMKFVIKSKPKDYILQIDLQQPMEITRVFYLNSDSSNPKEIIEKPLKNIKRQGNAYFVQISEIDPKIGEEYTFKIQFKGEPTIAKRPPWDGGWVFTKDELGRPWVSAAVQGLGASAWYPNKDYQGDEPDEGAIFHLEVPEDLVAVSNGKMWDTSFIKSDPGKNIYTWEVVNPINNYDIIPYIGNYVNFSDEFFGEKGKLPLSYWVLDYNLEKAKKQFQQVKPMLSAFEDWMGPYPFYEDSYKVVEAPYLGMEHQSAIAYGNHYQNGYLGGDLSGTGWGKKFDFILVHESGHEWFGNSITTEQIADMWVHEGFTTYSEAMYVENLFGLQAANQYVQGIRRNIANDKPVIGEYNVNKEGSSDMYYKGANMIHTLRQLIEDDAKFKAIMRKMNKTFYHQIVTGKEIEDFWSKETGIDLTEFFNQYLRTTKIPTLETEIKNGKTFYRWTNIVQDFDMPVRLKNSNEWVYPTADWKEYNGTQSLDIDPNFYIFLK